MKMVQAEKKDEQENATTTELARPNIYTQERNSWLTSKRLLKKKVIVKGGGKGGEMKKEKLERGVKKLKSWRGISSYYSHYPSFPLPNFHWDANSNGFGMLSRG